MTAKESFAQKCSVVLGELRAEAAIKIQQIQHKETNGWAQNGGRGTAPGLDQAREEPGSGGSQVIMEDPNFFDGEWNNMNFVSL